MESRKELVVGMVNRRLASVAVVLAALVGVPLVGAASTDAAQIDAVFDSPTSERPETA